jgi:hypothetical protein
MSLTYREKSLREYHLISVLWERYLSDWDYKFDEDRADEIFYHLLTILGGGSRQEIRDTIAEAKLIASELEDEQYW